MSAGLYALQRGLLAKLAADASLQALLGNPPRIYDVPPTNPTFPLLIIGNMQPEEWGARDIAGYQVRVVLHAFASSNRGSGDIKQINDVIRAILDDQAVPLTDGTVISCRYDSTEEEVLGDDGLLWKGGIAFRVYLQL